MTDYDEFDTQPTTAAGKDLSDHGGFLDDPTGVKLHRAVLAIEAEARAQAEEQLAMSTVPTDVPNEWRDIRLTRCREARAAQDAELLALRQALRVVSGYVLAASWPKGTPMEDHRQEVIRTLDDLG